MYRRPCVVLFAHLHVQNVDASARPNGAAYSVCMHAVRINYVNLIEPLNNHDGTHTYVHTVHTDTLSQTHTHTHTLGLTRAFRHVRMRVSMNGGGGGFAAAYLSPRAHT